jgi:hypothetical protein
MGFNSSDHEINPLCFPCLRGKKSILHFPFLTTKRTERKAQSTQSWVLIPSYIFNHKAHREKGTKYTEPGAYSILDFPSSIFNRKVHRAGCLFHLTFFIIRF